VTFPANLLTGAKNSFHNQ